LALRAAVADGTIDIIATDHAPHPREDKDCEWAAAAMGMLGLETALGVIVEVFIKTGLMDWSQVADRMSVAPARIGAVFDQGQPLSVGSFANLMVWDPRTPTEVDAGHLASRSSNSPYLGMRFPGSVRHVLFRGQLTVREGELT
jgi:dihydroorotase